MDDSLDAKPSAHGTIVEVGLCTDSAPVHSPTAAEQTADQGARFLDVDPSIGIRSTLVEDSGSPDLVQCQFLVGSNLSFPVTEVGKEAFNYVDIAPLSLWDLDGVHDFITLEDDSDGSSMEEEFKPSEWVRTMIRGFGTFVGFPIACCER